MIREIDKSHIIQINLACTFDPNSEQEKEHLGPYKTLNAYLKHFQSVFTPALWSYDFYPILLRNGQTVALISDFYKNMQIFYNQAKETKRPFWAYSMCMPYLTNCKEGETCDPNSPTASGRPIPTEGELRFEAFSALAYGAQGIVYWAYTQRDANSYSSEKYISAPIDSDGKKTLIWYRVQRVNNEIKKYNHVFCGCEVIEVAHVGKVYPGTQAYTPDFGYFKTLTAQNEGVLVSHIKNGGIHYLIIVNHNPLGTQHVTIKFLNPEKIIEMAGVEMAPEEGQRMLGPGGYIIFKVK